MSSFHSSLICAHMYNFPKMGSNCHFFGSILFSYICVYTYTHIYTHIHIYTYVSYLCYCIFHIYIIS